MSSVSDPDRDAAAPSLSTIVGAEEVAAAKGAPEADEAAKPAEGVEGTDEAAEPPTEDSPGDESGAAEAVDDDGDSVFGHPFIPRSFGGELVWADGDAFTSKVLRIRAGEVVLISTKGRSDMVAMLTGGRAVLEVEHEGEIQREEFMPGTPTSIESDNAHRIVAMTDVELFTAYGKTSAG